MATKTIQLDRVSAVGIDKSGTNLSILSEDGDDVTEVIMPLTQGVILSQSIASATIHFTGPTEGHAMPEEMSLVSIKAKDIGFVLSRDGKVGLKIVTHVGQVAPIELDDDVLKDLAQRFQQILRLRAGGGLPGLPKGRPQ